jgi:hypothetical protein
LQRLSLGRPLALTLVATFVALVVATVSGSALVGWAAIGLFAVSVALSVAWLWARGSFRL